MEVSESVDFSSTINSVGLTNINFIEVASTSVGLLDGLIRDLLVKYKLQEDASSNITISDVRLTYDVIYTKYKLQEVASSNVAISDVRLVREINYIRTRLDTEVFSSNISIADVRLV